MWKFMLHKMFKMREKFAVDLGKGDVEKPFIEHLEDLRTTVVRIALTLLIATVCTFIFYHELFEVIKGPLWFSGVVKSEEELKAMLQILSPQEGFMMMMNIALIAAVIVSFPFLLLFILQFVLPGLKDNEKKLLFPAIATGAGLFLGGVLFAYYVVLPKALAFFFGFNDEMGLGNDWRVNEYVTFATRFILVFGVSFELPILVIALVKLDILNYQIMKGTRAHAVIGIAIFSAIITPTQDALTMGLMVGPLYCLYEACIWIARYMDKKDRELYPEYYKDLEKDEAAVKAEDSWDNEDYNPWSTADDDDDEGLKKKDEGESKPSSDDSTSEKSEESKPESEKTLEDYAREDEQRRNTD